MNQIQDSRVKMTGLTLDLTRFGAISTGFCLGLSKLDLLVLRFSSRHCYAFVCLVFFIALWGEKVAFSLVSKHSEL